MVHVGSAWTVPVGTMMTVGAMVAGGGTSVGVAVGGTGIAVGARRAGAAGEQCCQHQNDKAAIEM